MDDLVFASARELAAAIRNRQVSAVEVLDAHLAQIDRHNPRLNVIVTLDSERARARAQEADAALARSEIWGPLHGVPITIKDGFATAGLRTTSGFPPWADYVPAADAPVVGRLRAAGAILLGKTNLPVLSLDVQTDNPIFGRTNNPWDLSRTCGGSTGGAAAVAAGMTPLELGTDLGGSVRGPAHCCGVYALKPSDFRIPGGGYHPDPAVKSQVAATGGPAQLAVFGPLARTVDDLALMFRVMAGTEAGKWEIPPVPVEPVSEPRLKQLRLAWADDFAGAPVSMDTRSALAKLAVELARNGCSVGQCVPPSFDFTLAWELWGEMVPTIIGFNPEFEAFADSGAPMFRGMAKGLHLTLQDYLEQLRKRSELITALEVFFEDWDALICPVMAVPAFPHQTPETPILVDDQVIEYRVATMSHNVPFNLTGHPVVVLPVGRSRDGLPIGVQVVGRRWGEMELLAVAKTLVEVIGPFQRPPGY